VEAAMRAPTTRLIPSRITFLSPVRTQNIFPIRYIIATSEATTAALKSSPRIQSRRAGGSFAPRRKVHLPQLFASATIAIILDIDIQVTEIRYSFVPTTASRIKSSCKDRGCVIREDAVAIVIEVVALAAGVRVLGDWALLHTLGRA
jgi:hypothetical protein